MFKRVFTRGLVALFPFVALSAAAAPTNFNAVAGYGTHLKNAGNDISIESVSLASETTEPDGRKRLEFNVTLKNNDIGYFEKPQMKFDPPGVGWNIEIVRDGFFAGNFLGDIEPNATIASSGTIVLLAPAADAESVKAQLLAKQRLTVAVDELYQFRLPAVAADGGADVNFDHEETAAQPGQIALVFANTSPALDAVGPGMFLVEAWRSSPLQRLEGDVTGDELDGLAKHVSAHEFYGSFQNGKVRTTRLFEVTQKTVSGTTVTLTGIQHGHAKRYPPLFIRPQDDTAYRAIIDNIRTGTLAGSANDSFDRTLDSKLASRHPWIPQLGNSAFTVSEKNDRNAKIQGLTNEGRWRAAEMRDLKGLFSLHFPFNEVQLAPGITLDGQMTLTAANVELQMKMRNFVFSKIGLTVSTGAEVDLRLTAAVGSNNTGLELFHREKRLFSVELFRVIFQVGAVPVEVAPVFSVDVGATINATASVVIPIQSSFEVGFNMECNPSLPPGQQCTYTSFDHETPLGVSKPNLSEAIALNASAFIEARLTVLIDDLVGPYVGARTNAIFSLTPLAPVWWNLTADLDLTAGVELDFLGVHLADLGTAVQGPVLFQRNAGNSTPSGGGSGPLDPAEGGDVRWSRGAYWDGGAAPNDTLLARVAGTMEDVFAALPAQNSIYSPVLRIGPKGDVIWAKASIGTLPVAIGAVPDGGVAVAGVNGPSQYLTRFDTNGNVVWARDFDLTDDVGGAENVFLKSVVVREASPGQFEFFVCGYRDEQGNTLKTDPFLLKYDNSGTLLFAKHYASVDAEVVEEAILAVDNTTILFCGHNKLSPDGINPPGPGASDGGWVMRAQATDGNFRGAARTEAGLGMDWFSITEAPDGRIFCGGSQFHTVLVDYPALAIGRYSADFALDALVTVGEIMPTDESVETAGVTDWLPNAGRTPFDLGTKVAWTPSGLVAGGITALGDQRAALLMNFTDKLALRWFTTHEGPNADTLLDFVATDDGLLYAGYTTSLARFGTADAGAVFLKVPYEGKLELHPGTHGFSKYLQPSVYDLKGGYDSANIPSPPQGYMGTIAQFLTPANQVVTTGNPTPPFTTFAFTSWSALQRGDANAAMTFAQWCAYHQIAVDPFGNVDNDARSNIAEWFFGGDPYTNQDTKTSLKIVRNSNGSIHLETTRSIAARNIQPRLDFMNDLSDPTWQTLSGATFNASTLDGTTQLLSLDLAPDSALRRFFRAAAQQ